MTRRGGAVCILALVLAASLAAAGGAGAVTLGQVGTYSSPVHVTSDPADPNRLFVVERQGRVMLTAGGQTTTFLDMRSLIPPFDTLSDRGLLSIAFMPNHGTSSRLYVLYSGEDGDLRVDEFKASADSALLATRRPVLQLEHDSLFHYGGQLQFGPDGHLYISTGDNGVVVGGPGGDPDGNAQSVETLHGKILRIDPRLADGHPYTVPSDNPFVGVPGLDEIWSYGLRNPWRFSFDRATGDLVLTDVGQDAWEEVEYAPRAAGGGRGDNYGWACREGPDPYSNCTGTFTDPAFAYPHFPTGCSSITGGYVVRDPGLPSLHGRYLYADFCQNMIRSLQLGIPAASDDRLEPLLVQSPSSFGEDACGRIYVASLDGPVYRLVEGIPSDCEDPLLFVYGKRRQAIRHRRVWIGAYADEAATVIAAATLSEKGTRRAAPGFKQRIRLIPARSSQEIGWKLGRGAVERYSRLLAQGRRVKLRFTVTAMDAAGNSSPTLNRTVRLVPGSGAGG